MKYYGLYSFLFFFFATFHGLIAKNLGEQDELEKVFFLMKRNPEEALLFTNNLLTNGNFGQDSKGFSELLLVKGQLLFQVGLYQQSSEALYQAENIFDKIGCATCLGRVNNSLGEVYYKIKSSEESLIRHEKALYYFQSAKDGFGIAQSLASIGGMHEKLGNYDKALEYQNEALILSVKRHDNAQIASVFENIGSMYEDKQVFDSAFFYFEKASHYNLIEGDNLSRIGILNNLGDVYRKSGKVEEGFSFTTEALELSQRLGNRYQQRSALVDLSKSFALIGDFEKSYINLEEARQLGEEIFSEESTRQLVILESQYGLESKNQEITRLNQKQGFDSRLRWLFVFLLALSATQGYLIYNRQKLKIQSNKELLSRQGELLKMNEKLIQTEKYNLQLLVLKMEAEEHAHSKSLSAQTLHVIDKNQMLEEIKARLKKILEEDPKDQKKKIRNLIKQIDFNFSHDTEWEDFKLSFEKVHQDFFRSLQNKSRELTPADLKLASLMRMNLSSKEVASTLGISMDSLRISRYRLRKKLRLSKEEKLQNFILSL